MTPTRARMTIFAVLAIFLATATNALFLQDRSHSRMGMRDEPSSAVSITQFPVAAPVSAPKQTAPLPQRAAEQRQSAEKTPAPPESGPRLQSAIRRELARKGYHLAASGKPGEILNPDILTYEYDAGLPLTGQFSEAILKRLIFDLNPAPRGPFADRAEADPKLVLETQKMLLELGFFSGSLSGRVDVWTSKATQAFQKHRSIPVTARLDETTLLELVSYSGQPLLRTAG